MGTQPFIKSHHVPVIPSGLWMCSRVTARIHGGTMSVNTPFASVTVTVFPEG